MTPPDPHAPLDIRASLEQIAREGKNDRERLGALTQLAKMDGLDVPGKSAADESGFLDAAVRPWLNAGEVLDVVTEEGRIIAQLWRPLDGDCNRRPTIVYFPRHEPEPADEEPFSTVLARAESE